MTAAGNGPADAQRRVERVVNTSSLPRPNGRYPVHLGPVFIGEVFRSRQDTWLCGRNGDVFYGGPDREQAVRTLVERVA